MTSTVNNKTKPNKDPRRVEAGKKLAEHNKRERKKEEERKFKSTRTRTIIIILTHSYSFRSKPVVLSLAIKEELMALVNKQETTAKHTNTDSGK